MTSSAPHPEAGMRHSAASPRRAQCTVRPLLIHSQSKCMSLKGDALLCADRQFIAEFAIPPMEGRITVLPAGAIPMSRKPDCSQNWAFGAFELEGRTAELRRNGVAVRLQEQPSQLLSFLLQHAGQIVTREDLRLQLWPADTFVDFDHALNTAVMKLREALGDSSDKPLYIQTLPRKGYRFVAPVSVLPSNGPSPSAVGAMGSEQVEIPPSPGRIQANVDRLVETPPPAKLGKLETRLYFRLALLGAVILAVGLLVFWKTLSRPPGIPKVVRFTRLTSDGQKKIGPLVSDGVRVYFNEWLANGRLVIVQTSSKGGDVNPLPVPLKAPIVQDLSKDGAELLVANDEGSKGRSIWVLPVAGGSPHRVGTVFTSWGPWGPGLDFAAFAEDGTHILYSQKHDIYSVSRDGSGLRKFLTVGHLTRDFRYSPDSQLLRFSQFDPWEEAQIMSASADGTKLHKLIDGCCGQWTPDGRYLIFSRQFGLRSDLWALQERRFRGQLPNNASIQLTAGPLDFQFPLPAKDKDEVFAVGSAYRAEVVRYDKKRDEFVPYLSGISADGLAFSADGKWVAYTSYPDGVLWRSRVDGSEKIQLTFPPMAAAMPRWSPDGTQIAFNATLPGKIWNIYVVSSAGGSAEHLLPSPQGQLDVDWSPDGKSLVFGTTLDPTGSIYILDLSSRHVSTLPDSKGLFSPHWSPDVRYISGTNTESSQLMLFDTITQSWTKPCDCRVAYPMWSHDGKYIYFLQSVQLAEGGRIVRLRLSDHKIENVADLSRVGRWTAGPVGQWFGLAPDDSALVARDISSQEIYALEMDWQ
jgi:Tol biopolymer transport system component/DNA-binding winged helix-turn-helix (wHTH) protein